MTETVYFGRSDKSKRKRATNIVFTALCVILIALCLILVFWISPMSVVGESMSPTLRDNQLIFVEKSLYKLSHGDVVVFDRPGENFRVVKRVLGLPGDTVEIHSGTVFRNGKAVNEPYISPYYGTEMAAVTVGENQFFVLGDNRGDSIDSRIYGCVDQSALIGKLIFQS